MATRNDVSNALKRSVRRSQSPASKGPSAGPGSGQSARRRTSRPATGRSGIDTNSSKAHLMDVAGQMAIAGRSKMTKPELVDAIRKTDNRSTRPVRRR